MVAVNVTMNDFVKAQWLSWGKLPGLLPFVAFVVMTCYVVWPDRILVSFIIFMYAAALALLWGLGIWRFKNNHFFKYELTYSWDREGLCLASRNGEWRYPWPDVLKVKEDASLFLVWVAKGNVHIIPKRCFPGIDDVTQLRGAVIASGVKFVRARGLAGQGAGG